MHMAHFEDIGLTPYLWGHIFITERLMLDLNACLVYNITQVIGEYRKGSLLILRVHTSRAYVPCFSDFYPIKSENVTHVCLRLSARKRTRM